MTAVEIAGGRALLRADGVVTFQRRNGWNGFATAPDTGPLVIGSAGIYVTAPELAHARALLARTNREDFSG